MITLVKNIKSKNNNDINLYRTIPSNSNFQTILYIGVTHGDEPQGEFLINRFIDQIGNINNQKLSKNLFFIPCLNPDGRDLKTRGNANAVDINRNFPTNNWEMSGIKDIFYSGPKPASEAETKFLAEIIEEHKPDIILTLHAPFKIVNFDGPAKELAIKLSKLNGYPVQEDIGYATPGSFGTFCGVERNIKTITLEFPEAEDVDNETLWEGNKDVFYYLAGITKTVT